MAETVKIDLEENGKYRVAYDLMRTIAHLEKSAKDREYFLRLYRQCYESVNGYRSIEEVVKGKQPSAPAGLSW